MAASENPRKVGTRKVGTGLGGWKPSETLWWSLRFLIERAELHTLRALHRRLAESGTTSQARGEVEDEIARRLR